MYSIILDWKYNEFTNIVTVQGNDTVGKIVDIGKNVTGFKVGDTVVGFTPQGDQVDSHFGCYAQYTVSLPLNLIKIV